jgi:6,7-dimethyl-8-ribityllumazine synthase
VSGTPPAPGPLELRPGHDAHGHRYALVAARFNEDYVRRLVDGAVEVLVRRGARPEDLEIYWVPGSMELPLIAQKLARGGRHDAVLAFGVVIRGETRHFELVADSAARGLGRVSLDSGIPVLFGVLAAENADQAAARCGGTLGNRGTEVALAAVQMVDLCRRLEHP